MQKSLLLVEDTEDDVFFFKIAMKKAGLSHDLRVASNGREAIEVLRTFTEAPNASPRLSLVLLDLKMPYVTGLEVLHWMRGQPLLNFLPVVVLTSSEQEEDIETAYRLGATSFLVKPSQPEGLVEALRAIDAFWFKHNRLPAEVLDRHNAALDLAGSAS
ncbi:MAG: response regulator [Verrucomicrobiota bacterium]